MARNKRKYPSLCYFALHAVSALLLGTLMYLLFRPDTHISRAFYSVWDIRPLAHGLQSVIPRPLLSFLRYYLPDLAWTYALTFTLSSILKATRFGLRLSACLSALFALGLELCQKYGIMQGTFDPLDIAFELCITALAVLIIKLHFKGEQFT